MHDHVGMSLSIPPEPPRPSHACGGLLADALVETIDELRLIDLGDMVVHIREERWANIADLVQSSAELHLEDGTLIFACSGDCLVGWGRPSRIALDLELQTREVTTFFTLVMGEHESEIEVTAVFYAVPPADDATATNLLARALAGVRR